ncbi:hypothetical protein BDV96DRAFT_562093 [Lophiotrema nucula]|uniref:Uncharacterized protein n=1 Tax=Lophiotrema nucula TaxID=690887 RepID=A0A6A5ZU11_9PLEO|nr:hypothetical protein BDV96DRAFT_562093 [Lophiotrema nucula]
MEPSRRLFTGVEGVTMNNPNAVLETSEDAKPPRILDVITQEQFDEGRDRRFGINNPEKMDIPFWNAMVECGEWAWSARKKFVPGWGNSAREEEDVRGPVVDVVSAGVELESDEESVPSPSVNINDLIPHMRNLPLNNDDSSSGSDISAENETTEEELTEKELDDMYPHPIWCNSRMGQSLTKLPDGTVVEIGGEHEDFYDPDFMIYNDVIVHGPNFTATGLTGKEIKPYAIYSYPEDVFPPTDFHTATYVPDLNAIFIIGCLGYGGKKSKASTERGETPVYRLDVGTWKITKVDTAGEGPGWIRSHMASLECGEEIRVSGKEVDRWSSFDSTKRTAVVEGTNGKKKHKEVDVGSHETWVLGLADWSWRKELVDYVPTEWQVKKERKRKGKAKDEKESEI